MIRFEGSSRVVLAACVAALLVLSFPAAALAQNACSRSYEAGQVKHAKGDLAAARRDFLLCTKACESAFADDCKSWIAEIDPKLARVEVLVSPSSARLTVDTIPESSGTILMNPGKHRVEATDPDFYPATQDIELRAGEQRSIVLELRPVPRGNVVLHKGSTVPVGPDPLPIALLTSSAVLLASGGALAVAAFLDMRAQRGDCGADGTCVATTDPGWACSATDGSTCDRERIIGLYAAAGAAAGAGLALGIAGVTALALAGRSGDDFAVRVAPWFGGTLAAGFTIELSR